MEYRTKSEIIRDIEKNRRAILHPPRKRNAPIKKTVAFSWNATQILAGKVYETGRHRWHDLQHKLNRQVHLHTYGALSVALSAGTIAGILVRKKLRPSPCRAGKKKM